MIQKISLIYSLSVKRLLKCLTTHISLFQIFQVTTIAVRSSNFGAGKISLIERIGIIQIFSRNSRFSRISFHPTIFLPFHLSSS